MKSLSWSIHPGFPNIQHICSLCILDFGHRILELIFATFKYQGGPYFQNQDKTFLKMGPTLVLECTLLNSKVFNEMRHFSSIFKPLDGKVEKERLKGLKEHFPFVLTSRKTSSNLLLRDPLYSSSRVERIQRRRSSSVPREIPTCVPCILDVNQRPLRCSHFSITSPYTKWWRIDLEHQK